MAPGTLFAGTVDPEELTDAMLDYMGEFQQVAAEGTVEEKRSFIRAFTGTVELDPETGKGRAELLYLPKETALTGESESAASSFSVVAGARYTPEKKTPSRIIDFDFERSRVSIAADAPAALPAASLAA